jgi:penicillin-binding protein-related factor A (putative recombinase)
MKLIKDGMVLELNDESTARMYLNYGWALVLNKKEPVVEIELTKKELQKKLDGLNVEYKPQENKSTLMDKLKAALPTNDFDDGLLKG